MFRFFRTIPIVLSLTLVVLSCGGSSKSAEDDWNAPIVVGQDEVVPQIVSSDIVAGEPSRLLMGLLDKEGVPITDPDLAVSVDIYDIEESPDEPAIEREADFFWAIPDARGMYEVDGIMFDHPGLWGAEVRAGDETVRVKFDVKDTARAVAVGEPAPLAPSPTAADVGGDLSRITTDPDPDPAFYAMNVPDAVAAGKPFVVVLGTPKFCTSGTCGPSLDLAKEVRDDYPEVNFVHVEIYENLETSDPTLSPVVEAWKLPTEPWVYVVGSDGNVFRRLEGAISEKSIRSALDDVS